MAYFRLYKDVQGYFRWSLKSSENHKIVADSAESYDSKAGALQGINWVKTNAASASIQD